MNAELSLVLGVICGSVAAVLSSVRIALNGFTGGRLRKIEVDDHDLAERLAPRLQRREEYRLLLRVFLVVGLILTALFFILWDRWCTETGRGWISMWLPVLLGGAAFLAVTEYLGRHLSTRATARLLAMTLPAIDLLCIVLFPIAVPLVFWQRRVARWRDARNEAEDDATAEDEIMSLVEKNGDYTESDSDLEDDERRMIRGIFDLDETLVHEIMTPRVDVDGIEQEASVRDLKAFIVHSGHSRIPVYRETIDQVVGVAYAKDLLNDERVNAAKTLLELLHSPVFVPETKNVGDLLDEFRQERIHFAVVLDEYGGTAGIVTIEDVLEEIVGEIRDEYDIDEVIPVAESTPDGALVVDGRTTIADINMALALDIPEDDDFDTVGGYISAQAGRIPQQGETVETEHLLAEIIAADPRRVLRTKVKPIVHAAEELAENNGGA